MNTLAKSYRAFEGSEGLCYYPTDIQAAAVTSIAGTMKTAMDRAVVQMFETGMASAATGSGPAGKALLTSSAKELDVKAIKEFVRGTARQEDVRFLLKFCETQMFATYIKETYQDKKA